MPSSACALLTEATALELAKLPEDVQREIIDRVRNMVGGNVSRLGAVLADNMGKDILRLRELDCRKCAGGGECINQAQMLDKLYSQGYRGYSYCGRGCCADCPDLGSCPQTCGSSKNHTAPPQTARTRCQTRRRNYKKRSRLSGLLSRRNTASHR